jgi:CubicO group peptidase (beta-lactamase class C family)
MGQKSLREGKEGPFEMDTVLAVASCAKLMTAVAVLQCVEDGILDLDKPVSYLLPEVGSYGIIKDWDEATNQAITTPNTVPITLR